MRRDLVLKDDEEINIKLPKDLYGKKEKYPK
jgi:hypothetical protein